jgi:polyisoprenyl-phosphate glycosyltransferase
MTVQRLSKPTELPMLSMTAASPYVELSIVLPAWNEAVNLRWLLPELAALLKTCTQSFELLVVDDGSTDDTELAMRTLLPSLPELRYVRLARNFGKEVAMTAGLNRSRGRAVILMDSDGQHPRALVPEMLKRWREGHEMVYSYQTNRNEGWLVKKLKAQFYKIMRSAADVDMPSNAGDFRLLDRKIVDVLNAMPERNRFMKGLYSWAGFRSVGIAFTPDARKHGVSSFGFWRLARLGMSGLTAFSITPLRVVSALGVLVSIAAIGYGGYIVLEKFWYGQDIPGFATLAAGMMFLSGLQLLALGVLGEYLGRVFEEVKARPLYVVAEELNSASVDAYVDDSADA